MRVGAPGLIQKAKETGVVVLKRILFASLMVLSIVAPLSLLDVKPASAAVPAGFADRLVTAVDGPTALAFTPDGRLLIADRTGRLRVYENGALVGAPALDISGRVCSNSERGLLGVAVDPNFASNRNVFVYYTAKVGSTCDGSRDEVNRVSRFTLSDANVASGEQILINNIPSPNGNHNGGDLQFGKDGNLYVSVGDGGCYYKDTTRCQYENPAARDRSVLLGKILRVTPDGGIPQDNPFVGANSARCNMDGRTTATHCQETFATGLRNPFRMAFDPDAAGTSFRINDVGGAVWEEIDAGKAGADYGWNIREGHCAAGSKTNCGAAPAGLTNPIADYAHSTGCSSITGGAFVPNAAAFPVSYDNSYFFGDYVCGKIFTLNPKSGGGFTRNEFATNLGGGGPIAMTFDTASGSLLYTTYAGGGEIRRISYVAGNSVPNAVAASVGENYGPTTKQFDFSGTKSSDFDGDALTYEWDFTSDGTVDATGVTASNTYAEPGKKTVTLTVKDGKGGVDTTTLAVYPGNEAKPQPVIQAPVATDRFSVGQKVTLRGTATDGDDGTISADKLKWEIVRHHNNSHIHPYFSATGATPVFTAPAPEDLLSTAPAGNYLEVRLTATDSQGLSQTVTRNYYPNTVPVRFSTRPSDFRLSVNGKTFAAPRSFLSWKGYKLNVYAPRQRENGRTYVFRSWSDGKGARHTITTPDSYTKYLAKFRPRR